MAKSYIGGTLLGSTEASDISFDNSGTDVTGSNVQSAITEVAEKAMNEVTLTRAEYDALVASGNVKVNTNYYISDDEDEAFDMSGSHVSYNNSKSNMKATTVQAAIDELSGNIQFVTEEAYLALEAAGQVDPNVVYFVDDGK